MHAVKRFELSPFVYHNEPHLSPSFFSEVLNLHLLWDGARTCPAWPQSSENLFPGLHVTSSSSLLINHLYLFPVQSFSSPPGVYQQHRLSLML